MLRMFCPMLLCNGAQKMIESSLDDYTVLYVGIVGCLQFSKDQILDRPIYALQFARAFFSWQTETSEGIMMCSDVHCLKFDGLHGHSESCYNRNMLGLFTWRRCQQSALLMYISGIENPASNRIYRTGPGQKKK